MTPARRTLPLAVAALGLLGGSALARVFWVREGVPHGPTSVGQPGWNPAHIARLEINGGTADLEVIGCQLPPPDAERLLLTAYRAAGGSAWGGHGLHLGWGLAFAGGRVIRWLIFSVDRPGECVVVRLTQTREEFLASARPPERSRLEALPPLPSVASMRLHAADLTHEAAAEVADVPMPPAAATGRLESDLLAAGWVPAVAAFADGSPAMLFRRGRDLCAVHAAPAANGGAIVIRFHKRLDRRSSG